MTTEGARILPQTHRLNPHTDEDRHLLPRLEGDPHPHTEDAGLRSLLETDLYHHIGEGHRLRTGAKEDPHLHTESADLPSLLEKDLHHMTEDGLPPNITTDIHHRTTVLDPPKWNVMAIAVSSIARAGIIFNDGTLHRLEAI